MRQNIVPTYNAIRTQAIKLYSELYPSITYEQAFVKAKKSMTPLIVQALLDQLPANIRHKPGDQFYPDLYLDGDDNLFARGQLDHNLTYHVWRAAGIYHYDLFQQSELARLIADLTQWSIDPCRAPTQTAQPEPGGLSG